MRMKRITTGSRVEGRKVLSNAEANERETILVLTRTHSSPSVAHAQKYGRRSTSGSSAADIFLSLGTPSGALRVFVIFGGRETLKLSSGLAINDRKKMFQCFLREVLRTSTFV